MSNKRNLQKKIKRLKNSISKINDRLIKIQEGSLIEIENGRRQNRLTGTSRNNGI